MGLGFDPIADAIGRALVAASGVTTQSRARQRTADSFRTGGPRILRRADGQPATQADMMSVQQPLPVEQQIAIETQANQPYP